jgi:MSHA biogenesis protein MshN
MSLINQVLQDLEARHARQSDDVQVPRQVRAVAVPTRRSRRGVVVMLLGLLGVAVVAFLLWSGNPSLRSKLHALRTGVSDAPSAKMAAQVPAEEAVASEVVEAQVEAALMIPVFQLSEELSKIPGPSEKSFAAKSAKVTAGATPQTRPASGASGKQVAASGPTSLAGPRSETVAPQKSQAKPDEAGVRAEDAIKKSGSQNDALATVASANDSADETLEEVVIPADIAPGPIEKQARQLTAFERAENAFRLGVASLRRGQMADAEAQFRAAISEDRSHDASLQALVGILIDAGRQADAEAVLAESLSVNPRQPKQAMILARLQVERGDLDLAIQTLETTRTYAGTDGVYLSFLGAVFQRAGRHEEAVAQYRNALAFMPRNPIWLMGLGISLRALDRNDEARQAFDEAAAIGTLNPGLQAFVEQQRSQLKRVAN